MTIQGAINEIKMLEVPFYAEPSKTKIIETIISECHELKTEGYKQGVEEFLTWAYVHGINFGYMDHVGKQQYIENNKLEQIKESFYNFKHIEY